MAITGLTIIGESINDSVPSTHTLFEANDIEGIKALAKSQDEGGAAYIDVNVGLRSPEFMAEMIREVQSMTAKPLSIDTPDPAITEAALKAYDLERAGGKRPILNSITLNRLVMFDLYAICPFRPILLSSEQESDGGAKPNHTGEENYQTARALLAEARKRCGIANEDCLFDPGIAPIGSDTEGFTRMVLDSMRRMHEDPDFNGVHKSVGLSNFTVMLPVKRGDGSPVKGPLESAFLTLAMPLGLDTIIGSVKRNYQLLGEDHPALACLQDVLKAEGYDAIMRVMEYYA